MAELKAEDEQAGQCLYMVLRFRMDHPGMRSGEMATSLSASLGKPLTDTWVRKKLHAARGWLARLLLECVSASLESLTRETLEEELIDLELYEYCKPALAKPG